jgi:hypothetical protein
MKLGRPVGLVIVGMFLTLVPAAYAQDATLSGTVRDNTGGVLPGVTITATHEAQGTTYETVTDEQGLYRLPVRAGLYRISAELAGFTTVIRPGVELLLGRTAMLNLDMGVSGVQETVTVTGEAPLIDTTSSNIAGNIDPRQMQDLPINGRNWMDLTMLAPGSRSNSAAEIPQNRQGMFQINVDGQQVTFTLCCFENQPRYSRDAIAEFELTTNRFDATKGRTSGMMVNAITKSGTNTPSGTFSGYFRDDRFNAKDFIQDRVIPYSDQQYSGTFGGPIIRDRMHFFVNAEWEREPSTVTFSSPYPSFNIDLTQPRKEQKWGPKMDWQFTPQARLSARYNRYQNVIPYLSTGGATNHPSTAQQTQRIANQSFTEFNQVLTSRTLNSVKFGTAYMRYLLEPYAGWGTSGNRRAPGLASLYRDVYGGEEIDGGVVRITFSGYTLGNNNNPQSSGERVYTLRDDFTTSYDLGGRHDVKTGVEYMRYTMDTAWCNGCNGTIRINARPPANIEQLIPVWDDASTWNLNALSPLVVDYTMAIGDFAWDIQRNIWAGWYQDDWSISNRLTLNLGLRYDVDFGGMGEKIVFEPWLSGRRPSDSNNFAPRTGFAYSFSDRTVIRGGYGLFFTQLEADAAHKAQLQLEHSPLTILNDGRPDFATNPFNGPMPSYESVLARMCDRTGNRPGCITRSVLNEIAFGDHQTQYSHMTSIGLQHQLGAQMAFESNYVFTGARKEEYGPNINLTYDPVTGTNYPFQTVARRPFPEWGVIRAKIMGRRSNYHGWENSFTKRFSDRWQASASYALGWFRDDDGPPVNVELVRGADIPTILHPLGFPVAADLSGEYGLAATDQRHRATFNGIWDIGMGFQLSGLYFFGSGERFSTSWGGDLRNLGSTTTSSSSNGRLRPDGVIVPRNDLSGHPIHRVDLRFTKRQRIVGRATVDGMLEVFNLFNHENYGSYTTQQSSAAYGQPSYNGNVSFQPRIVQLGFRLAF